MPIAIILLIIVALIFDFWNGLHDSSNVVATMISTHAMPPRAALVLAAIANGAGPFLFGVAVAKTIGSEVISAEAMTLGVVLAALLGAIAWNIITWAFGIPSSSSHALIGGLLGAAVVGYGFAAVELAGLTKILLALLISPPLGMLVGFMTVRLLRWGTQGATPDVNTWFRRGQIVASTSLALAHGTNDAQKTMGIITMGLLVTGVITTFEVPMWVIAASATAMACGTLFGGWKLIRTLGSGFYKVQPIHGLGAQAASSTVILSAALLGGPVSTTQVVSSAIVGAGSAERARMVRWNVFKSVFVAWLITIPLAGLVSGGVYILLFQIFGLKV
ncbi:anion permease [Chloroflexota bacterium]